MSSASRERRRALVEQLRDEGAAAFRAGRHPQTCPHRAMDQYQWLQGYHSAADEAALTQQEMKDEI